MEGDGGLGLGVGCRINCSKLASGFYSQDRFAPKENERKWGFVDPLGTYSELPLDGLHELLMGEVGVLSAGLDLLW